MRKTEKQEVLVPLLYDKYPDEKSFQKDFKDIIEEGKIPYLRLSFGLSISITNIITKEKAKEIRDTLKDNKKFEAKIEGDFDKIDESMFEKESDFSFKRWTFRSKEELKTGIKDKDDKDDKDVNLFLFISIACTQDSEHHILSFNFTTWDRSKIKEGKEEDTYRTLSNEQIIDLVRGDSEDFKKLKEVIGELEQEIKDLLKIDKNTFLSIQFWRKDWKSEKNNFLDARDYVSENPFYFYSIVTRDKDPFRKNYKSVMDILGWCESISRVYLDVFYENVCLEVTLKPKEEIFDEVGHDSDEFRVWEMLALQKKLLAEINTAYNKYSNTNKHKEKLEESLKELVKELHIIYDFNAFIKKREKGEKWIRFGGYLQDVIGIVSDYDFIINDKYEKRFRRGQEEEEEKRSLLLSKLNFLFIATIFVSISIFLLDKYCTNLIDVWIALLANNHIFIRIIGVSLLVTFIISVIFLKIFLPIFHRMSTFKLKRKR